VKPNFTPSDPLAMVVKPQAGSTHLLSRLVTDWSKPPLLPRSSVGGPQYVVTTYLVRLAQHQALDPYHGQDHTRTSVDRIPIKSSLERNNFFMSDLNWKSPR